MPEHTVRQGDCISSIAEKHGLFWEKIWNHPRNANLKERRKDPNVLHPGDAVFVPEKEERQESGATEQKHRFRRKGVPEKLRIYLKDEDGEARANVSYILTIDGENRRNATDGQGLLEEPIPPGARQGRLVLLDEQGNPAEEEILAFGHLDPIEELSGVQMRLSNLGYDCGPADGRMGPRTSEALRAFQRENGMEASGRLDDATRAKLQEVYGS